ncbi:restriction endonuclease subunit S [Hymenobacter crusticola]|uniref:Type I restriction modification DNA specificity domain-containing protein n=1 Tax=Hymenobacter crusticola TaxID=1770526 RepID=A0A243W6D8_9BACT|nr:restriction endonuclease subunit S [Hymenobacter crusticola]OUJ69933.1 hypothetical protein BXP70_25670 [Hymenobacter crusticola]
MKKVTLADIFEKPISGEWGVEPTEQAVNILRTTNFTNEGRLNLSNVVRRDIERKKVLQKQLRPGDIIIEKSGGSPTQPVGRVVYFDIEEGTYLCNNFTSILRPKASVHPKYALHMLYGLHINKVTLAFQNKTTGIINLKLASYLADVQIPLPPIAEQRHIARVLDAADRLRQQDQQLLAQYEQLVQAMFVDMFGDPVRNEKGWNKVKLADFIHPERPVTYGILMPGSEDIEGGVPYVRVVDIKGGRVLHNKVKRTTKEISDSYKRSLLIPGDLLISIRGHVGRLAITPPELNGANITQDTARLSINAELSNPEYVHRCLEHIEMQRIMQRYTKGVAVKGINLGDLRKIEIPLPPLKLQRKFADTIKLLEAQYSVTQELQQHSEALFNSLLQQAFRGQLTLPVEAEAPKRGGQLVLEL